MKNIKEKLLFAINYVKQNLDHVSDLLEYEDSEEEKEKWITSELEADELSSLVKHNCIVNVVESSSNGDRVWSFFDVKDAEALFKDAALVTGAREELIDLLVDDGCFESGDYRLLLIHSE